MASAQTPESTLHASTQQKVRRLLENILDRLSTTTIDSVISYWIKSLESKGTRATTILVA